MSIDEGDPKLSAYGSIHIIKDEIINKRLDLKRFEILSKKLALDLDLSKLEGESDPACVGKILAEKLRAAIDSGKIDFWDIHGFLEDHFNIPPEEKHHNRVRKAKIRHALNERMNGVAATLMMEGVDFLAPGNKEPIDKIFRDVEKKCLQELGILDKEGNVIPGQELFV